MTTQRGLLVHGVVRADRTREQAPDRLRLVVHGELAAAVAEVALDEPQLGPADLRSYHRLVDGLTAGGPVVPVRFGSVLTDPDSVVEDLLAPRHDELVALLDALAARTQFVVRARYIEDVVLTEVAASDRRIRELSERTRGLTEEASWADRVRLGELVAHGLEARRREDAAALLDALLPLAVELHEREGAGSDHVLDVALLVDDDRRGDLERTLEKRAEAWHGRVRLSLLGPMAPYDFVGSS